MTNLKACPFCAGVAAVNTLNIGESYHSVCMKCGVKTAEYDTPEEAINKWNRRIEQ